jgi:hypothetical protein
VSRVVAVVAVVLGVALIVVTLALSMFSRTDGAQKVVDAFRVNPMSQQGLRTLRADFVVVRAGGVQLVNGLAPTLARQLGLSPAQFEAYLKAKFPAVATAVAKIPGYNTYVGAYIPRLEANRKNFEAADSLPGLGLPVDSTPWLMVGLGVLVALAGLLGLRSQSRGPIIAIGVLGLVLSVGTLALSIPSKASDARTVATVGRDALSAQKVQLAQTGAGEVDRLVTQTETQLVPALAAKLHTTPAQVSATIAKDFPAVATFLARWHSDLRTKAFTIAAAQRAHVNDFAEADAVPFKTLPWLLIVPGIVLVVLAGIALVRRPS